MRDGGVGGGTVDASVEQSIQQAQGGGWGLSEDVREPMEQAFGADFSGVRVHTDGNANQLNSSLHSRAFTTGPDIFFKQGEYNPGSRDGQELLAHELTHVVQQNGSHLQSKPVPSEQEQGSQSEQELQDTQPHGVLGFGNSLFLWRMVQTKLDLSSKAKDDKLQKEATTDRNEQEVIQFVENSDPLAASLDNEPTIQAKCSKCEKEEQIQRQTISSTPSGEENIQAFGLSDIGNAVSSVGEAVSDTVSSGAEWVGDRVEDVAEVGEEAFADIVARFSPQLAELIRNGPEGILQEKLEGGIESWLQGVMGNVDIATAIGQFQGGLEGIFTNIQGVLSGDEASCQAFADKLNSVREFAEGLADNPVIQALQEAFSLVSSVFQQVSDLLIAPAFDALMGVAGGVFNAVTEFATTIWNWGAPIRDFLGKAWNWVLEQLGIGGDGEGGILSWLKEKASSIWSTIKETFGPVIEPITNVLTVMLAFSPVGLTVAVVKFVPQLVESVQWLWANKDNPDIVKTAHEEMGNTILPGLLSGIQGFSQAFQGAVSSFVEQVVQIGEGLLSLLGSVTGVPLLSLAQGFVQTISDGVQQLVTFAQTTFQTVSESVVAFAGKVKAKIEPYIGVLTSLGLALVNPSMIPVILAGTAWRLLPDCYKAPIINLLLDAVIGFLEVLPDLPMFGLLWPMIKAGVLGFLQGVRNQDDSVKVAVTNKLAKIISGGSPAFMWGFVKGFLRGLWEGLTDPFVLAYQLINGLSNLMTWLNDTANQAFSEEPAAPTANAAATEEGAAEPGVNKAEIGQSLQAMSGELQPPVGQVTEGFMPALQEEFSGGEGLTFEGLMQKLSAVWGAVEAAITNAGGQLAEKICEFMMQDSAEGTMGNSVGWLAGTIVFEVVLAILTAGTANAARGGMKVLQVVLKVLDWTGEALGLAFKGLAKLGSFVIDIVKGIGKLLRNAGGAAKSVLGALGEIGETLMRYADELLGKVGKGAAGETAEEGVEKTTRNAPRNRDISPEHSVNNNIKDTPSKVKEEYLSDLEQVVDLPGNHQLKYTKNGRRYLCSPYCRDVTEFADEYAEEIAKYDFFQSKLDGIAEIAYDAQMRKSLRQLEDSMEKFKALDDKLKELFEKELSDKAKEGFMQQLMLRTDKQFLDMQKAYKNIEEANEFFEKRWVEQGLYQRLLSKQEFPKTWNAFDSNLNDSFREKLHEFRGDKSLDTPDGYRGGEGQLFFPSDPGSADRTLKRWFRERLDDMPQSIDLLKGTKNAVDTHPKLSDNLEVVEIYEQGYDWIVRDFDPNTIPLPNAIDDPMVKEAYDTVSTLLENSQNTYLEQLFKKLQNHSDNVHWSASKEKFVVIDMQ